MDRWAAAVVAATVLVAGCSAVTDMGASDPEPTVTPAPVPDEPPSARDIPGLFPNGSVDSDSLARTHSTFVGPRNYTWEYRLVRTDAAGNTPLDFTRRVRVGEEATIVRSWELRRTAANQTLYLTNESGFQRIEVADEYDARELALDRESSSFAVAATLIRDRLPDRGYRMRVVERAGRQYLRIHHPPEEPAFGDSSGNATTGAAGTPTEGGAENYTVTAYLTRDGFVQSFSVTYAGPEGGRVSMEFAYTEVENTTVATPEWVTRLWGADGTRKTDATGASRPPTNRGG